MRLKVLGFGVLGLEVEDWGPAHISLRRALYPV